MTSSTLVKLDSLEESLERKAFLFINKKLKTKKKDEFRRIDKRKN